MSRDNENSNARLHLRELGKYLMNLSETNDLSDMDLKAIPMRAIDEMTRGSDDLPLLSKIAFQEYQNRARRDDYLDADLFADPAWDILLDLFVAKVSEIRIAVSSACIASRVPNTTALRWLHLLEVRGFITRTYDFTDRRRSFVELSDKGFRSMASYLRNKDRRRSDTKGGDGYVDAKRQQTQF